MAFWAYLPRCMDGSFYTGHTDDLETRIAAHQSGAYEGYTKKCRPVTLVWAQDFPTRLEALEAERRIKGWSRAKKEALIQSDWQALRDLSRNRQAAPRPSTGSGRTGVGSATPNSVRAEPVEASVASITTPSLPPPTPVRAEPVEARLSAHPAPNPTPDPNP